MANVHSIRLGCRLDDVLVFLFWFTFLCFRVYILIMHTILRYWESLIYTFQIENIVYLIPDLIFIWGFFRFIRSICVWLCKTPLIIRGFYYHLLIFTTFSCIILFYFIPNIDQIYYLKQYILLLYAFIGIVSVYYLMPKQLLIVIGLSFSDYRSIILSILDRYDIAFSMHSDHVIRLDGSPHMLRLKKLKVSFCYTLQPLSSSVFNQHLLTTAPIYVKPGNVIGFESLDQIRDFFLYEIKIKLAKKHRRLSRLMIRKHIIPSIVIIGLSMICQWGVIPLLLH